MMPRLAELPGSGEPLECVLSKQVDPKEAARQTGSYLLSVSFVAFFPGDTRLQPPEVLH